MSHRFKAPKAINPQERRDNRELRELAARITDQGTLEKLLADSSAELRTVMADHLRPYLRHDLQDYLRFALDQETVEDCPVCGMKRGSVILHPCDPDPLP